MKKVSKMVNYAGILDVGSVEGCFDDCLPADNLAADGISHKKCCEECAFLDPYQRTAILEACAGRAVAFYCVHRDDRSTDRVCAGSAAYDRAAQQRRA